MKKSLFNLFAALIMLSLLLAACGGGATPTSEPSTSGEAKTEEPVAEPDVVASSGYVCPKAEPKMEVTSKELNLFVWTEYIPPDMQECFELIYGVTVNREEYSSNEEMYAKLSAGGTNYDLVQPTDYIVSLMIREGLLQKMDKSKLSNVGNIDTNYMNFSFDPNNEYTLPWMAGTDAIIVNTDKVTTVPTKWADMWNPEYAGRMVYIDDSRAVIGTVLLTLGYDVNTKDEAQLEEAKVKLAELVKNIKLFDSDSPKTALIAGDVDLGMTWTGEAFVAQQENPAFQYIYPEEGAILWMDNWAIPVSAPHLDALYAWINYTHQANVFWMMLRDFPYTTPNKASLEWAKENEPDLYDAYINSPVTNTPAEAIENGHWIDDVGDALPIYDRIWTEVKGSE